MCVCVRVCVCGVFNSKCLWYDYYTYVDDTCFIPLSTASIDQPDTGHIITGPVITGPVGTGSTRSRQAKQRSVLKEAFKNAWKQGNITTQVS